MTDKSMILAVLAEEAGAEAVLRHAALAAEALPGGCITGLHVRVDQASTIMPTEEVLSDEQARVIELEGERESAAVFAVFEGWRAQAGVQADWKDVVGTVEGQVRDHAKGRRPARDREWRTGRSQARPYGPAHGSVRYAPSRAGHSH